MERDHKKVVKYPLYDSPLYSLLLLKLMLKGCATRNIAQNMILVYIIVE